MSGVCTGLLRLVFGKLPNLVCVSLYKKKVNLGFCVIKKKKKKRKKERKEKKKKKGEEEEKNQRIQLASSSQELYSINQTTDYVQFAKPEQNTRRPMSIMNSEC